MKNTKFAVNYAALALAVLAAGAISIYGGDDLSNNLKTAVIGDYGYSSQPLNYQARNFFCYPGPLQSNDGSKYGGTYNTYMYSYGEAYANSGVKGTWCTNYLPTGDTSLFDDPPLKTSTTNTPTDHTTGYINSAVYKVTDANGQEDTNNVMYRRWQSHINHAKIHENKVVFYENTLSGYGTYYKTGASYGTAGLDPNGSGIYAYSVVHCPAGAVVVDHATTASQYKAAQSSRHYGSSPTQEDGLYDGAGHKWCELNGVTVNPVMGPETGKSMPDFASDKSMLFKFTFPNGSGGSADFYKYHNTWNSLSIASANSDWVKCEYGIAGPFIEGTNNHYISPYDSQTNQNKAKTPHYHCLSQSGSGYVEPVKDTVGPQAPYNTWSFLSGIMYSENTCATGDATCGGAGTIGATGPCSRDTYYYQTTDIGYRRCLASATPAADTFTPPVPSWTISAPTNLRITGTKTTGFASTESVPVAANFAATGTGIPYGQATLTVQIAQDTSFGTAWVRPSSSGSVTAVGSTVNSYIDNFPATGTFYWRAKMALGTQESAWTVAPYGSFVVCSSDKIWNGTSCVTPTVATCSLDIKLNDNKTTYAKGDMVNYTYSCTPAGTKASSVTVQVVKPDGTATTYNSGTNISTATLGFSTSNLDAGNYILRACLNSTCTSGIASANFTIGTTGTTTPPVGEMTLRGTIFKDGQYVDPATFTLRNCVSPNAWMKEETVASGARGFHCMPNYTATTSDYPPASCTGTLWAGSTFSADYCATTKDTGIVVSVCNNNKVCDSGETTANCPADCPSTVARQCGTGEKCPSGSWCNNGKQCFYSDGSLSCAAWTMNGDNSCATVIPGTKECSPTDTDCLEPGSTGSIKGWCKNSMECFTSDGAKKFCQPYSNEPGKMTSCPAGSKLCGLNDPNCIEPGSTGSLTGWCKNSQECFSRDGTKKYCNPWPANMTGMMGNLACPAEYPKECRPDDKNCVEVGESSKNSGAWCAPGGKQCYLGDGALFCADEKDGCPKDSKKCPANPMPMPNASSSFYSGSQCIEDEGPIDGWCGGSSTIQCYNKNGKTKKCLEVNTFNDPAAWESITCPADYNRCAPNSVGCLGSLGAKGKKGDWCTVGMTKDNGDGTVTCVAGRDWVPEPLPKPLPEICTGGVATVAYDPTNFNCKTFSSSCNIPANWTMVNDGRVCQDGKLVNLNEIDGDDASFKKILEEKKRYLKDLELRLVTLPAYVSGVEPVKILIRDAELTIKTIYQSFPTKSESNRKIVRDKINSLIKDTIPAIETQMNSLNVYVDFNALSIEIRRDLERYKMILESADDLIFKKPDPRSEYYARLKDGVTRLESLLKNAETATGDTLTQFVIFIKTQWHDLQSLVDGYSNDRGDEFLADTIDDLNLALEKFESIIAERNIETPFILNHMDKFRAMMGDVAGFDSQKVNKAVKLKDKLAMWLDESPQDDLVSIDKLMDMIDQKVTEAVDKALSKLENKLQLVMDEKLKEVTIKLAELTERTADRFSAGFTDKVVQNTNNMTAVPDAQKDVLAEDTSRILDRTEALVASVDNSDLSTFEKEGMLATMEKVASNVWCGDYAQRVQSELNSKGLALEAASLEAEQVAEFDNEINGWIAENQRECYEIGVTPGMDVSINDWYHPYTMYNKTHGYIKGYGDGNIGPANATLRIEALAIVMRLLDIPEGDNAALDAEVTRIAGVPEWGIGYVNGAKGFLDKSWNMAQPITRAETARLFVAAMTSLTESYIDLPTVIDSAKKYADYSKFAGDRDTAVAIEALTDAGIFRGAGDGGFHPYDNLLRSEFAAVNQRVDETFVAGQNLE